MKVIELWGAKKVFNSEQIDELRTAAKNEPVPVATVQDQRCDLSTIPVGVMAGLVKVALNGGHEPWRPLRFNDDAYIGNRCPWSPGGWKLGSKNFIGLLEKDKLRRAAQQKPPSSLNEEEEDPEHRAQQDDRKRTAGLRAARFRV